MAREVGVSDSTVGRIWRANGLKPHRVDSFKVSNDPEFANKLKPSSDSTSTRQNMRWCYRWTRKARYRRSIVRSPGLPLKKGRAQTMTHDYKRNGTTTLFAALDTATGEVFGLCQEKHRHQEWLKFLRMIDEAIPEEKEIYLICDNYATHKHARVQRWLRSHKRFHVRFTPTSASWLTWSNASSRDLTQTSSSVASSRTSNNSSWPLETTSTNITRNQNPSSGPPKASDILQKVTRAQTALNKRPSV